MYLNISKFVRLLKKQILSINTHTKNLLKNEKNQPIYSDLHTYY